MARRPLPLHEALPPMAMGPSQWPGVQVPLHEALPPTALGPSQWPGIQMPLHETPLRTARGLATWLGGVHVTILISKWPSERILAEA